MGRTEARLQAAQSWNSEVQITAAHLHLDGTLAIPAVARGLVLFAHGSGSSRHSPRNRRVAEFEIVPGAAHLFEEAGALDQVAAFAARWFAEYLSDSEVTHA